VILPIALLLSGAMVGKLPIAFLPVIGATIAFSYSMFLLLQKKSRTTLS